jgi:hypothetical protein
MSIPSALGGAGVAALGACLSVSRLLLGLAPFTDVRFRPKAVTNYLVILWATLWLAFVRHEAREDKNGSQTQKAPPVECGL